MNPEKVGKWLRDYAREKRYEGRYLIPVERKTKSKKAAEWQLLGKHVPPPEKKDDQPEHKPKDHKRPTNGHDPSVYESVEAFEEHQENMRRAEKLKGFATRQHSDDEGCSDF